MCDGVMKRGRDNKEGNLLLHDSTAGLAAQVSVIIAHYSLTRQAARLETFIIFTAFMLSMTTKPVAFP